MPSVCNRENCNCAVQIVDDNGVTNPERTRIEFYECADGHTFSYTLKGTKA